MKGESKVRLTVVLLFQASGALTNSAALQQGRDLCWETSAQVKDYTIALN